MSPRTNPAVVIRGRGDLVVTDLPMPTPQPDEAVVRMAYGGICGSDLHYWRHGAAGESVLREPMVLGHEVSGTVVEEARDGSGPSTDTPVTVHPATPRGVDGVRYPVDRPNLSPAGTYLGSAARLPHTQGAFARYVAVATRMLRVLPAGLDLRTAALVEPASVAWHAVARAGEVDGKTALVVGAGPIGALVIAVLRAAGASEIVAIDLYEDPLRRARMLGADRTILASDAEAVAAVQADVAIESSGSAPGLGSAIDGAARGGRVVMLGLLPPGMQPVPVSLAISRELDLLGSFRFHTEMDPVIAALADESLIVAPVITHEFPVAEAAKAFDVALDPSTSGKVLLRL